MDEHSIKTGGWMNERKESTHECSTGLAQESENSSASLPEIQTHFLLPSSCVFIFSNLQTISDAFSFAKYN